MASKMSAPTRPGFYWVRYAYRAPHESLWSVSSWDGKRWTNIGHECEWTPEESSIVEWSGPLVPPSEFSVGAPFVVPEGDAPVAVVVSQDGGVRDVLPELNLRAALRWLWSAWSDAEGEGQPIAAVYGPDEELERTIVESGGSVKKAPQWLQDMITDVVGPER
jgi:hypothetical protein